MRAYLFTIVFFAVFAVRAQNRLMPVIFETTREWSCDTAKEEKCGTFAQPLILRLTPVNCPDSLVEEFVFYNLIPMTTPRDTAKKMHKVPADRNVYFVSKGHAGDSFFVNLSGTVLKFTKLPDNKEQGPIHAFNVEVVKEGKIRSFHLDINIPELNMTIDRNLSGKILLMYRKNKIR